MTDENQVPVSLVEEIEIMLAVGGLSPAQYATFRKAAARIAELEAACSSCYDAQQRAQEEVERLHHKYEALAAKMDELYDDPKVGIGKKNAYDCIDELRALLEDDDD